VSDDRDPGVIRERERGRKWLVSTIMESKVESPVSRKSLEAMESLEVPESLAVLGLSVSLIRDMVNNTLAWALALAWMKLDPAISVDLGLPTLGWPHTSTWVIMLMVEKTYKA
jgi:hypothetical protein